MRNNRGFTLVEAMIVVVVLAILTIIAYPSYQTYLQKGRRADAQQLMLDMQSRQRQILIEQRAYATAPNALNVASSGWTCTATKCSNNFYDVTFNPAVDNTATPPSYTICAVPTNSNQTADGTMLLNSTGTKERHSGTSCSSGTDLGW